MVIVSTREGQNPGLLLLVDMRNELVYMQEGDNWIEVALKRSNLILVPGEPFPAEDYLGVLKGLTVKKVSHYSGPHPGGSTRCSCGVLRNDHGFCPRCHDNECHVCGGNLTNGLCKHPAHNPLPVPPGVTKPIKGEDPAPATPRKWPQKYRSLHKAIKKIINHFFANRTGNDRLDRENWEDELILEKVPRNHHDMGFLYRDYDKIKVYYKEAGPLE